MADNTKTADVLMDWTICDDIAGVPSIETDELDDTQGLNVSLSALLHIDICHNDALDAGTNYLTCKIWVKTGSTDESWHIFRSFQATAGQANAQILAAASGSGQTPADRVQVAATANFDAPGDSYFLKDTTTLADSCIVVNKDVVTNDYVEVMDDMVRAYDTADYLYDIVDHFTVNLPDTIAAAKVTFHNSDGDATYACRVHYSLVTGIV